jgi:hypothetical protein
MLAASTYLPRVSGTKHCVAQARTFAHPLKEDNTMVNWLHDLSYFFGGVFLANAIPHFVSGSMGRPFQSPFAHPPGEGLSSSTVNVLWSFVNFVAAYLLIACVGQFDVRDAQAIIALGLGALLISLGLAKRFGRFNGGNLEANRH